MNMELNNKEDVDPLVTSSTNVEAKINDIQANINTKLRPILHQLNQEGEPNLAIAQDKSMQLIINIVHKLLLFLFFSR